MISCAILERPGKWRLVVLAGGLLVAFAPVIPLLGTLGDASNLSGVFDTGFRAAILRSLTVAVAVTIIAATIGIPTGILGALYDFPLRRLTLALLLLPLLVPSFLWAIGLSMLRRAAGLPPDTILSGFGGTVITFTALAVPLVVFISLAAARAISASQTDAARLAGGESHLFRSVAKSVLPIGVSIAALAGVLTLSDPGAGQILGFPGAASEVLTSFAAQYDLAHATGQCLFLAGVVLLLALPLAMFVAPKLAAGLLARDVTPTKPRRTSRLDWLAPILLCVLLAATTVLPLAGFIQPLLRETPWRRALADVYRTLGNTFAYALIAAVIATGGGFVLAIAAGRDNKLRAALLAALVIIFAMPPTLGALGFIYAANASPAELDPLLRSRFTVGLELALRSLPIAAIFGMRAIGTASPSWAEAAAIHGVPLTSYFGKVLCRWLLPAALVSALLTALLVTADISTVLLLHPPGEASLPLAIFTVMANAPEPLVGALCLFYVGGAGTILILGLAILNLAGRKR